MWWTYLLMIVLLLLAIILIFLVLIQRGKGGGLAGAFGGMGGQSAFGTKAGDTFTKITVAVATVWILVCVLGVWTLGRGLRKLKRDVPVYLYGAKPRHLTKIRQQVRALKRKRLTFLTQGRTYRF